MLLHELTCLLGLDNLHCDLTGYLLFHSAILNNAMCILSHDMFAIVPIRGPLNIIIVSMNFLRVAYVRLNTDSLFCHLCMTTMHETKYLASIKEATASLSQPSL